MLCDEPNQTKPKYLVVAISTSTWMPIQSYQVNLCLVVKTLFRKLDNIACVLCCRLFTFHNI